jgi:hypothetical protein
MPAKVLKGNCSATGSNIRIKSGNFIERMSWYNDLAQLLDDIHELCVRTFRVG